MLDMNPSSLRKDISAVFPDASGSSLRSDCQSVPIYREAPSKIFFLPGNNRNEVELMSPTKEDE